MPKLRATGCHFIVHIPIYENDMLFVFGYSKVRIDRVLSGFDGKDVKRIRKAFSKHPDNYKGITVCGKRATILVVMPCLPVTSAHYATLAHEIFHAVQDTMNYIGNPLGKTKNAESWAYLLTYITKQVYENLNPYYD